MNLSNPSVNSTWRRTDINMLEEMEGILEVMLQNVRVLKVRFTRAVETEEEEGRATR